MAGPLFHKNCDELLMVNFVVLEDSFSIVENVLVLISIFDYLYAHSHF